jgi:hypothetical protein
MLGIGSKGKLSPLGMVSPAHEDCLQSEHFEIDQQENLVLMSDREKGLAKAVDEILPNANHSHCCQHIAANIQSRFGITCRKLFWAAAYDRTKGDFDTAIDALLKESTPAASYLLSIPAETWACHAFPVPRYGHITSNIVESLNGTWKHLRHLPPLRLLSGIWSSVMETFCERRERVQNSIELTNQAKAGFDARYEKSRRYRAIPADENIVQVMDEEGKDWIVDLEKRTCTCFMFQEYGGPCGHAIITATRTKRQCTQLVYETLSQYLAAFHLLFQEKEDIQKLHVFASVR